MNATLSTRQLRLVALLVGVVILAAGYLVVSRHKSPAPSAASSTPASTTPTATTPAQTTPTQTTPSGAHTVTPATLETHGLPLSVARALRTHRVVVVSLTEPNGSLGQLSAAEAQAAAAAMHAGYVYINVFHQRSGTALLRKLGVFSTPTTLVVKRGGNVYADFKGFVDRTVVEQSISDAHS